MATKKRAAARAADTATRSPRSTQVRETWTFLTNHAHVLLCLAASPELRVRDVAERVGITERAVQRILGELEDGGYLQRSRVGRRSMYTVTPTRPLRHPIEAHRTIADLIALVTD
jgi:DNA-binding MarR family transcriptional regulator